MGPSRTLTDNSTDETGGRADMSQMRNNVSGDSFNCLTEPRRRSAYRSALRRSIMRTTYPPTPVNCRQLFSRLSNKQIPIRRRGKSTDEIFPDDPWKGVLNKSWDTFSCSPLYLFRHDAKALKQYSKHLSAHVVSMSKVVACVEDEANHASISLFKDPKTGSGSTCIEITLSQMPKKGASRRIVLSAYLYASRQPCEAADDELNAKFMSLPILLVKGPIRLTECLISWWQVHFDCVISRHYLTSIDLCWMVAMFSGYATENTSRLIQLVYNIPETVEGFTTVKYGINSQDCYLLWRSIHPEGADDTFDTKQVMAFLKSLEAHFYHHFRIILSALNLVHIGTPIVSVSLRGKLKFFSSGNIEQILAAVEEFQAH